MHPAQLSTIEWNRPWLTPLRDTAQFLIGSDDWRGAIDALALERRLVNHRGMPIVFADQKELPSGVAYETFISLTGRVPTRDNLHDLFNALVWLTYPLTKARLNAVQATEIARALALADRSCPPCGSLQVPPVGLVVHGRATVTATLTATVRGAVRDRATVFDENAALLVTSESSVEAALQDHDWQEALVAQRSAFGRHCEVRLFGHALMEKLVAPYKAITAHVWVLRVTPGFFALVEVEKQRQIDFLLDQALQDGLLGQPGMALPVLGVPGWWQPQDAAFYNDPTVFRPKRLVQKPDQALNRL